MGNSATRRKANEFLKKIAGIALKRHILDTEKYFQIRLNKKEINDLSKRIVQILALKPGDIFLGCDGFNKKVATFPCWKADAALPDLTFQVFCWEKLRDSEPMPLAAPVCVCSYANFNPKHAKSRREILHEVLSKIAFAESEFQDLNHICANNGMLYYNWRNGVFQDK